LFRYRARNWPETLSASERARWNDYRRLRLREECGLSEYTFETFRAEIGALRLAHAADGRRQVLLDQLEAWGREVEASLA
jgi:exodeoxyribonuclease-1